MVQPEDLVRIPATNIQGDPLVDGHSFVVTKNVQGNWWVIDDTDPGHTSGTGPIVVREHAFNTWGFGHEVLDASVAFVSRLESGPSSSFSGTTVTGTPGQPLSYGNGPVFLDGSQLEGEHITAGNGDDFITAGSHDIIKLGQGSDVVQAGSADTIDPGNGNDQVIAGANSNVLLGNGNDSIFVGSNSTLRVGNGNDTISAGENSTIHAGNGNDVVSAGNGSTIILGNGTDTATAVGSLMHAGSGHDTFVFNESFGTETIMNFNVQKDTIELDHADFADFATVHADMSQHGPDTTITDSHGDSITFIGLTAAQLTAHQSDFHII